MTIRRRQFVAGAAAILAAPAISARLSPLYSQTPRVRRSVNTLSPTDPIVETYKDAVRKMHALPATDERSWRGQARIHLDHCHRQPQHFLPWHRLYTIKFEDIIRQVTGNEAFTLPYWDWTANPQMPRIFFGSGNPLDTATWNDPDTEAERSARLIGANNTLASSTVNLSRVENQRQFAVFSNRLENGPHGGVHVAIGGHMSAFLSPLDPIFYLHHCNVDRIWARWNTRFANPSDNAWLNERFPNMFADRQGALLPSLTARDALDTLALGYTYDDVAADRVAAGPNPLIASVPPLDLAAAFAESRARATNTTLATLNTPLTIPVAVTPEVKLPSNQFNTRSITLGQPDKQILARLSDISIPMNADGYRVRVFLNCSYLSPSVMPNDPHYVGEFNLFGLREKHHDNMPKEVLFDLTETMVNLNLAQDPVGERIQVQLMPVPVEGAKPRGTEFKVGKVEIISVSP
jgi:tyrosinase